VSRPTTVLVLAALAAAVTGPAATADPDDGSDDADADPAPVARPLRIRVELEGTVAKLVVTELVDGGGPDRRDVAIDLPPRAVVTAATVRTGKTTHPLALTDADVADERLADIQAAPRGSARTRAVAITQPEFGPIAITVLTPRRTQLVLELALEAPTCFVRDHRHVAIPDSWVASLDAATRRMVVDPADGQTADGDLRPDSVEQRCTGRDDGWSEAASTWLALPTRELASQPAGDARIGARGGRFVDGATQAARIELALSSTLAAVPGDLVTAFVVDDSRSVIDGLDTQRAVIRSYLRHAPGAAVQVIAFDHSARALLPKWSRASVSARAIDRTLAALDPRNGSDLDTGLAEAGRWLARQPGTRRVVVFTDELFPERVAALDPARLAGLVPAGTVVHVVTVDRGVASLARDDEAALAPLAAATEGMAVSSSGDDALDALALVRPTSLDHVRVIAPGFHQLDTASASGAMCVTPGIATPIDLAQGTACTWWATGPTALDEITVEGLVWGRRWREVVPLGDPASVEVARELGGVLQPDRAPALAAAADLAARAVNSRWSLLATWGGGNGYGDELGTSGSISGCGCGGGASHDVGISYGHVRVTGPDVEHQIGAAIAVCRKPGDGSAVEIGLETTREEIVGVTATITGLPAAAATVMRACVEAAVWELPLVVNEASEHRRWSLRYP